MVDSCPTALSRQGIKRMVECGNIATEMKDETVALQIVDATIFDESNMKKNIKARLSLSDGVSKCIGLLTQKAFEGMVSTLFHSNLNQLCCCRLRTTRTFRSSTCC